MFGSIFQQTARARVAAYFMALSVGLAAFASSAQASHFRYAHNTWQRISGNTVEFTSTQAWRASSVSQLSINFGDGTAGSNPYSTIGTFTDVAGEQYTITRYTVQHTYAGEGPYLAYSESCCRISTLVNAADAYEHIETVVDLRNGNQGSPVSSIPVIVQMIRGGVNTVNIPASDPDGDTISCRMGTYAESLIPTVATAGGNTLAVSSDCVLTWDTSGTTVGQKYAAQVAVEETHAGNTSRVALDFIIEIIDGTLNQPPTCAGTSGTHVVDVGQAFQGNFTGTDPEAGNLQLNHLGLPPGATLTPAAGTTQASPFNSAFDWTPQISDAGSAYAVTIVYTDSGNLTGNCAFSLRVPLCGDGIIDPAASEQCDPGAEANGCEGTEVCTSSCACTLCGNGTTDQGETCDDGNRDGGDGCDATCQSEQVCGNGIVETGEDCDEGTSGLDACCNGATCRYEPSGTACTDDNDVCTNDECNAVGQCTHPNNTASCDDGDQCTGSDVCGNGTCGGTPVVPPACDDNNGCTDDGCSLNACTHVNNTASCDDGDQCTGSDVCSNGTCGGTPVVPPACDDSNGCTDDGCSLNSCTHTNNTAACEDGQFCTDGDTCGGGSCQPGPARDCGAGSACSISSCDEENDQCVDLPDPEQDGQPCDDNSACTNGTTCSSGVCGGGTTLDCDDSDTCTTDSCDPESGCLNPVTAESRACASCEDGIDNDSAGGTDYEDCSCNALCESFDYAVIGTRPTSRRTVYMGGDTDVLSAAVTGGAGFTSRASVCAERELALIAEATIDGAAAARQNAVFGTGTDISLGFFAARIPPGTLTTTAMAPIVGPGGLTLTDPANVFPAGSVDLTGTHEEYTDCGLAIASLEGDRDALLALTPTVELGAVTSGIGGSPIVVSGPGPHVLHMTRLRVRGQASLTINGDADSVVIVQIDRTFSVAQRAGVQVGGNLKPSNVIWVLDRTGRVYIGSDTEEEPTDADAVFAGTVLAPGRNIVVGKRTRVAGALLGRKVQLNGGVVISHHPFTGVGP